MTFTLVITHIGKLECEETSSCRTYPICFARRPLVYFLDMHLLKGFILLMGGAGGGNWEVIEQDIDPRSFLPKMRFGHFGGFEAKSRPNQL